MVAFDDSSGWGQLARVREVVGSRVYFELAAGTIGWADIPAAEFEAGQTVLVFSNYVEPAPTSLWREETFVSVVRIKRDDITALEFAGHIRTVPTNEINYDVGNTVEATAAGVIRVLDSEPLSIIDLPAITDSAVEGFIIQATNDLGTFADFGGLPDVIRRARKLIETPLKYRNQLKEIGAPQAKGVLFVGLPGTGKTMLARIIARESGAKFYQINGPEIVSKWVGQTEELLRKIFEHAQKQPSAIIFFDEIDSIAEERRDESHEASRRVVAQLLTLLDSCRRNQQANVIVIGATNRPHAIDPALRRPGRFDWEIFFPLPDREGREQILIASSKKLKVKGDLSHADIASRTNSWTPADLAAIWTEAAMLAVTDYGRDAITDEDYVGGFQWVQSLRDRARSSEARVE
jgi:transitional endoplasmic reticulum ATPase